ncbi:hypothetical protein ACFOOP_02095 [Marinicaulis aureus]|uniref:HTH HARE-type domain-containing protein n=1 Tax=Hyphococcus aureus TaxID=2666033 RepID=A0ABW1KTM7_9PROT
MNENGNKYALAALKDKRATLSGEIADMKKQIKWREDQLAHVDATIAIFEPGFDVDSLPLKRPRKRVKLFKQGELGRLIFDALRRSGEPMLTADVVTAVMEAQGYESEARSAFGPRVRGNLAYQLGRGTVEKTGIGRDTRWRLSDGE